mgnify:FL=1
MPIVVLPLHHVKREFTFQGKIKSLCRSLNKIYLSCKVFLLQQTPQTKGKSEKANLLFWIHDKCEEVDSTFMVTDLGKSCFSILSKKFWTLDRFLVLRALTKSMVLWD